MRKLLIGESKARHLQAWRTQWGPSNFAPLAVAVSKRLLRRFVAAKLLVVYILGIHEYETTSFQALITFQFYFALRIGEITDLPHNIRRQQLQINDGSITITFQSSGLLSSIEKILRVRV